MTAEPHELIQGLIDLLSEGSKIGCQDCYGWAAWQDKIAPVLAEAKGRQLTGYDPSRGPHRAHSLIVSIGADTLEDLAYALRSLTEDTLRNRLTRGCSGGPSVGWLYSYSHRPEQTHDVYFQQIDEWLERDSNRHPQGEDPKGLSGEAMPERPDRREGIAQ